MKYKVKYFGRIAELLGRSDEELYFENVASVRDFRNQLTQLKSQLRKEEFSIAVDKQIKSSSDDINASSEIAILPPFAGG